MLKFSDKQLAFWRGANRRWNVKCGAVRSGKTFLDCFLIPRRIRALSGLPGLCLLMGESRRSMQRNLIEPLRSVWGSFFVGDIRSDGVALLFGEKVFCLGADCARRGGALLGSSVKYCCADEVTLWNPSVFDVLKSRLDKPYSLCDVSCNPADPFHPFKKFLDGGGEDVFSDTFTIYDNPFLSRDFVASLEREYAGSVLFDRYILGRWCAGGGLAFPNFAKDITSFNITKNELPLLRCCCVGYDLGGRGSDFALVACGVGFDGDVFVLRSLRRAPSDDFAADDCVALALNFISEVERDFGVRVSRCYVDDNCFTVVNSLNRVRPIFFGAAGVKSVMPLRDRPFFLARLLGDRRLKILDSGCEAFIDSLARVSFDSALSFPVFADGSGGVLDVLDAFFYSVADDYSFLGG